MKIVFLIRSLNYGGAERQLVVLAKGLQMQGCNVKVAVYYSGGPLEEDLQKAGIEVLALEKKNRWDIIGFLKRLTGIVRDFQPDVLHGYLGISNILSVIIKISMFSRVKAVWGVRASNMDFDRYDSVLKYAWRIVCLLSRFADKIIVNSFSGRDYILSNGFPPDKLLIIPNGIDINRFYQDLSRRKKLRDEWNIPMAQKIIGLIGRLDPMKGHDTFIRAASLLSLEREDIRFVCVGDGPPDYRKELQALAMKLRISGRLIWSGARSDMTSVYNALDVLCSSSSYGEGFSNVIGESMACGVPCVVTDVGDSSYIVGDTGVVVPPESPERLAEGIKIMLSRLDDRIQKELIAQECSKRIASEFSVERLVQNTFFALNTTITVKKAE